MKKECVEIMPRSEVGLKELIAQEKKLMGGHRIALKQYQALLKKLIVKRKG
mgnify:FL=1